MSFVPPAVIGLLSNKLTDIMYLVRGTGRLTSEDIGMPKAVTDDRKGDYFFRDIWMTSVTGFMVEIASRIPDKFFLFNNMHQQLGLNKIANGYYKKFPNSIKSYVAGNLIRPQGYGLVPHLLRTDCIPNLEKNGEFDEARRVEQIADHIEHVFNPSAYLEKVAPESKTAVLSQIKKMETIAAWFHDAHSAQKNKKTETLKLLQSNLRKAFKDHSPTPFFSRLLSLTPEKLDEAISEHIMVKNNTKLGLQRFWESREFRQDNLMRHIKDDIVLPAYKKSSDFSEAMLKPLSMVLDGRIIKSGLERSYKSSELWLKLPVSLGIQFVVYGLAATYFDAKYLQPYQRELSRERGNAKELMTSGYIGMPVGAAITAFALKSRFIQKAGYLGGIVAAAGLGLGSWAATSLAVLHYKLAKPRVYPNPGKPPSRNFPNQPAWFVDNTGHVVMSPPHIAIRYRSNQMSVTPFKSQSALKI